VLAATFCCLHAGAAEAPFLTLRGFKTLPSYLHLDTGILDKRSYFEHLSAAYKYKSGFQRDASGLCPAAHNGAQLALPSCLLEQGVRYALFVGDSLTREVAWSFARLAAARDDEACQHTGGAHERWMETKHNPSFTCTVAPRGDGPAICGPDAQLPPSGSSGYDRGSNGNVSDCCDARRFSMYFHDYDLDEADVHATLARYRVNCPCPFLLYFSVGGMHRLLGEAAFVSKELPPTPWSFPFGRAAGVRSLLTAATAGLSPAELQRVVLASTPQPQLSVMMLSPPKFDWRAFADFGAIRLWAEEDRRAARNASVTYARYYEASKAFRGLQCDGIHFGNAWEDVRARCVCCVACAECACMQVWVMMTRAVCMPCHTIQVAGCAGFTSVTDLVTHQYLNKVCLSVDAAISVE
jgi:hypothetical protein